jgi:hypothetical protein
MACSKKESIRIQSIEVIEEVDTVETEVNISNEVTFFNATNVVDNYVLINDAASNSVFIIDKNGNHIHDWPLGSERLGNDAFLLPNGKLLAMLEVENPSIGLGGFGGKLQLLNKNGSVDWSFEYASEKHILHHDAEMLPNGNIIIQIWEKRSIEDAQQAGYIGDTAVFPDGIIEIEPNTKEIVWEWHVWDHIIQDHDSVKENFGSINENPQLIDLNYAADELAGDITHANGLAYDSVNDLIYLSVNFFSEIWVIDHSTNTAEASSNLGGDYNKGGDLIYRFGNPTAYKNTVGQRLFHNNHYPNLLKGDDLGNILVYSNGAELEQSTVYELKLPEEFTLEPNSDNEPDVVWSFEHPDLFAPKVSGAEKLPNGNILITEGDFGLWEVTQEKEIVWQYQKNGFYWRGYGFDKNDPAIISLELEL